MEPAKIDWKRIESIYVEDNVYEHINAPKWVDFLASQDFVDDDSWFCRPDCKHPKTAEDFFKATPTSKLLSSAERIPLGDRNQRDARLKRRGQGQSSFTTNENHKFNEDSENQNPSLATPPIHQTKSTKAMIKSSTEKKKPSDDTLQNNEAPRLKSTLSARNLFAGKEIMSHLSDFCNELKKLAMRVRERENVEKLNEKKSQVEVKQEEVMVEVKEEGSREVLGELDVRDERKPLVQVGQKGSQGVEKGSAKEKQRRIKRFEEAENIPISLNMENVKHKGEDRLLQIRTNPPSPQCFSATRTPMKTNPSKVPRSRFTERGILQELKQNEEVKKDDVLQELKQNEEVTKDEVPAAADKGRSVSIVDGTEARGLDVFWFLKPCTLSGLNG
ncbi:hypothetical protein CFOL_v3_10529 [Cephalotus follicularis]|uniref:Uncharacterized protein n=1 Tax=Cephalotus follicularis TaxID=3775 RepID=A0A1Q3BG82_CEPFO|nr:hypothetical protein CFOL_v3_10529 [Cephalotus follicularis]